MSLPIVTTPPAAEPVSIDEVKQRLRLASTDDDAAISAYIIVAREHAERISRRSLVAKSYSYALDRFPFHHEPIRVPAPPLASVVSIAYLDETLTQQTWAATEYFVAVNQSPGVVVLRPGFTYPCAANVPGAIVLDFTSGPDTLPASWKQNIIEIAAWVYDHPAEVIPAALVTIPKIFEY